MKNSIPSKLGALFAFRNEDDLSQPLEILVYEDIGKDPWTGEGLSVSDMLARLDQQQPNREILMRVNSRGGDVHEGLLGYNRLNQWKGRKVGTIDGVAASIASVMLMACDEVRMPKSSQMFIHDVWRITSGDEAAHADAVKQLATTSDLLADIYSKKTGRPKDEIRDWMRQSKLMNGEEAKALGFADTLIDGDPLYNFSPDDLHTIRAMASGEKQVANHHNKQGELMDRSKILALLNKAGVTVDEKATEEQLLELLAKTINKPAPAPQQNSAEIVELRNALTALTDQRNAERKDKVTRAVHQAVLDDKISLDQENAWVENIMSNEKALDMLNALPSKPPGVKAPKMVFENSSDPLQVLKNMEANVVKANVSTASERGVAISQAFNANREKLIPMLNAGTNTISTGLKRDLILNESMTAFREQLLALTAVSTVYTNVPMLGTGKVQVPYFPLRTDASTSFNQANGYVMGGTTNSSGKELTVDQRIYQPLDYASTVFSDQPFFNVVKLLQQNMEKLASDVMANILALITEANFGAGVVTVDPAVATSDDIIDVRKACNNAKWPKTGRSLLANPDLDAGLMKDTAFKNALNYGGSEAIREGRIPKAFGFDYMDTATLPTAEKLIGFALFPSAILVATAPVMPADGVRQSLVDYSVITDPLSGISFNFRHWGDPDADSDKMVIEIRFARAIGEAAAGKRIVSP